MRKGRIFRGEVEGTGGIRPYPNQKIGQKKKTLNPKKKKNHPQIRGGDPKE